VAAGAGPAAAAPAVLYAAPAAFGTGDCSAAANACTLTTALGNVAPGGVIELIVPGGATAASRYVGNWAVTTSGTTASAPVTIEAAPGLASQPVLDGDGPNAPAGETCSTASCNGPVLTVQAGQFVALSGITIANAFNISGGAGGLDNAGTVTITGCAFTGNYALFGAAIDSGDHGGGSVTVTGSTFTGNLAGFLGGAIESGFNGGGGTVTVTASTFTGNYADNGGAIDSGDNHGAGSVTVTASTFTSNTANLGGAIDSGDNHGAGSVTVTASTFTGNIAKTHGGAIDSGDQVGGGTVQVAGDLFDGSCYWPGGTWTDGGYNAGTDTSCFAATPPAGDTSGSTVGSDLQTALTGNGGPTKTIKPTTGNPAIALIPDPATITLGSNQVALCPATDQRGYPSAASTACDAGAVQTSGSPPTLTLTDSAAPASFNAAGQVITYSDKVSNTGAGTLSGIAVTDPAVPGVSCPAASLAPGASETCKGSYTTTAADLAAGKITDTATTGGTTANGVPVASSAATVTVPEGWPPLVSGTHRPAAHAPEGYRLGAAGNTWTLYVTHPGTTKVSFTGKVSVPAGTLGHLSLINPTTGHQVSNTGKAIAFTLPDSGTVTGFSFTTTATVASITFTLNIDGHPAPASQIFLGSKPAHPASGSPLTFTR
jgi:predicted outer membrane repeat protein